MDDSSLEVNSRTLSGARIKFALSAAAAPAVYTVLFLLLMILWKIFGLPIPDQVYSYVVDLFREYGLAVVFLAALIEGLVVINLYFPGSAVILLGVATAETPLGAIVVVILTTVAFIITAYLDFLLGYFGLHWIIEKLGGGKWLEQAHIRRERYGMYALPLSFIHPNLGGFMSVSCGVGRIRKSSFLLISSLSIISWNAVWGFLAYFMSSGVKKIATEPWLLLIAFIIWTTVAFLIGLSKKPTFKSDYRVKDQNI